MNQINKHKFIFIKTVVNKKIQTSKENVFNWLWISQNPNITWDVVKDNLDKPWDWDGLSQNLNITWDIIKDNPDKPWDWYWLSQNVFLHFVSFIKQD